MPLIDLGGLGHFKDKENAMVAAEYSATKTYKLDEHCYYQGVLKTCIVAITTPEAFTAAHWKNTVIADELTSQSKKIDSLTVIPITLESGYLGAADGQVYADSTTNYSKHSPYIPVTNGTVFSAIITFNSSRYRAWGIYAYNKDKEYISRIANAEGGSFKTFEATATINNSNIRYVRFSVSSFNDIASTVVRTYQSIAGTVNYINDGVLSKSKNLYNTDYAVKGKYVLYSAGTIGTAAAYEYYLIPVEPSTVYSLNYTTNVHVAFFEGDFSGYISGVLNQPTITTPDNCHYMTVSLAQVNAGTFQVEKGSTSTEFVPYQVGFNGYDILYKTIPYEALDKSTGVKKSVVVGSDGDYTSLLECLATEGENVKVFVKAGTYNIVDEYETKYGSDYFTNYTGYTGSSNIFDTGLCLSNGVEIIGLGEVSLVFDYDGNNASVKEYFSPISTTVNTTLENVSIIVADGSCRYCVHDDFASGKNGTNIFRNVKCYGTPSLNTAFGCGMGTASTYIIEDCYIASEAALSIAYHNNVASGSKNTLIIKGCYCSGGIRGGKYGASTEKSLMMVSNCKASSITAVYTSESYQNDNIELVQWNNVTT